MKLRSSKWKLTVCLILVIIDDCVRTTSALPDHPDKAWDESKEDMGQLRIHVVFDRSIRASSDWYHVEHALVWPAVGYWNRTLSVLRRTNDEPIRKKRDCIGSTVQIFNESSQTFVEHCYISCARVTLCGLYEVPPRYLAPCYRCKERNKDKCSVETDVNGSKAEAQIEILSEYLLFVYSANDSNCVAPARAASSSCQRDSRTDRPVIGSINICPQVLSIDTGFDESAIVQVIKHEMAHVLGFSDSLFPYYRDRAGNPLVQRDMYGEPMKHRPNYQAKILKKTTREWESAAGLFQRKFTLVVLPSVVREVRSHFACDQLEGAELEGHYDDAINSHWEKRIFVNELMASTYTESAYVSRITLALMNDTGWYNVRMSMAEKFDWGAGLGCDFATLSCYSYMRRMRERGRSIAPYCDTISSGLAEKEMRTTCDGARSRPVFCNLRKYFSGEILPMFQHFSMSIISSNFSHSFSDLTLSERPGQYGGALASADYCPFLQQRVRRRSTIPGRWRYLSCEDASLQQSDEVNNSSETFGQSSLCLRQLTPFVRSYRNERRVASSVWGSGCYKVACTESQVTIKLLNSVLLCTEEYQVKHVAEVGANYSTSGILQCPSCADACGTTLCPMKRVNAADDAPRLPVDMSFDCQSGAANRCPVNQVQSLHFNNHSQTLVFADNRNCASAIFHINSALLELVVSLVLHSFLQN